MITEATLPELGENIQMGVVVNVLVSIGDKVDVDQAIIEIETDKAVVEVPSEISGVVTAIHVVEGDEIKVGQKMVSIEVESPVSGTTDEPAADRVISISPPSSQTPDSQVSSLKTIPLKKQHINPKEGKSLRVKPEDVAPAAPSVRRFAREIGVDINALVGTGPAGRVSIEDVKESARKKHIPDNSSQDDAAWIETEPLPDFTKWGDIERAPMSMIRKKTAHHLSFAWATIPQVTQFDQANITDMEKFRKDHGDKVQAAGGKLTVTAILMKIVAGAMRVFPRINASVDMKNQEIIYKKYVHIGVAVDTPRGLLVPVVRDVDKMNLIDISVALSGLAEKARSGKLGLSDMQGGNFTISNLGGIGGTAFTPIVNAPEVAILGISRSFMEPGLIDDRLQSRLMLPLSLSYDHRIIDGAEGARFLRWIVEAIEQPLLLAL